MVIQRTMSKTLPLVRQSCSIFGARTCFTSPGRRLCLKANVTHLTFFLVRAFSSKKQESYFNAIGGDSDEPPQYLTPAQVTSILRRNENSVIHCSPLVSSIECNQLASNHPIEDRLRVSRVKDCPHVSDSLLLGVFDGHGGGACAEVVSQRLFHYICLALSPDPVKLLSETHPKAVVKNLVTSPKSDAVTPYDERGTTHIQEHVLRNEVYFLARYAEKLIRSKSTIMTTEEKIKDAFVQCDQDLSEEIQYNLASVQLKSNLLKHYYMSLAVSGCCANVVVLHDSKLYVANTGDCRAVIAYEEKDDSNIKVLSLSHDHNSDNVGEIKRIFESHPKKEHNNIIRYHRLLGQLMPLRAFGDFGYKWPVATIRAVGLIKAFGPHVIPPFYHTPPYLIAEPEVTTFDLKNLETSCHRSFLVMATDGLWEQFASSREVTDVLWKYQMLNKPLNMSEESSLEHEDTIDLPPRPSQSSSSSATQEEDDLLEEEEIDSNQATYLLRSSLCQITTEYDMHASSSLHDAKEIRRFNHNKLVADLTLPQSVVRNFRDDISIIIVRF